jgi:hypothetical protein
MTRHFGMAEHGFAINRMARNARCMPNAIRSLFLLAAVLAGSVARVALGFLLGLERRLSRDGLLLLARDPGGIGRCCCLFAPLLFGLGGLALLSGPLAIGYDRLALGAPFGDLGIIEPRLGSEFVQEILLRLLCCFLSVREAGFLKSAHRMALSVSARFDLFTSAAASTHALAPVAERCTVRAAQKPPIIAGLPRPFDTNLWPQRRGVPAPAEICRIVISLTALVGPTALRCAASEEEGRQ